MSIYFILMVIDNAPLECHQIVNATPHGCPAAHTNKARQAVVNSGIDALTPRPRTPSSLPMLRPAISDHRTALRHNSASATKSARVPRETCSQDIASGIDGTLTGKGR